MSYATTEAALATLLRSVSGFDSDPKQISAGDFKVLNRGFPACIVLTFGGMQQAPFAGAGVKLQEWTIHGSLYIKYSDDITLHDSANSLRQKVLDYINSQPTFDHATGIIEATIRAINVASSGWDGDGFRGISVGSIKYYMESIEFVIGEVSEIAFNES